MATYTNVPVGYSTAELDEVFARASSAGETEKQKVMLRHVPPFLQANFAQYLATYLPPGYIPALTPTQAIVANGGNVVVHSLADANLSGSPGVATVAASALTKVNLTV